MSPDDPVCLCFHVSRRKIVNFIRVEKPRRASQLSECFGAGTGCGWCRKYLERLLEVELAKPGLAESVKSEWDTVKAPPTTNGSDSGTAVIEDLSPAAWAAERAAYIRAGGGVPPPGAAPVE